MGYLLRCSGNRNEYLLVGGYMQHFWLVKSEPTCFSIDDLSNAPNQTTCWDGVRNFQARNFIRTMKPQDLVLYYHSNCNPPAIVGLAEVVSLPYADHTAFDPQSDHPDLSSNPEQPRWFMVDIQFKKKLAKPISLAQLKSYPELENLLILRRGNRLSVTPISRTEWEFITELAC